MANKPVIPGSHMSVPRWVVRLVLAGQMYAFIVLALMTFTSRPWWRMVLWLIAALGVQAGMLFLAALTDPKRTPLTFNYIFGRR